MAISLVRNRLRCKCLRGARCNRRASLLCPGGSGDSERLTCKARSELHVYTPGLVRIVGLLFPGRVRLWTDVCATLARENLSLVPVSGQSMRSCDGHRCLLSCSTITYTYVLSDSVQSSDCGRLFYVSEHALPYRNLSVPILRFILNGKSTIGVFMITSRIVRVAIASALLSLALSFESQAQWVQVNNGLNSTILHEDNVVIVSPNTDCVDLHSGPSVSDPIIKCEPAGTIGQIVYGPFPDEHGSSDLTFWNVEYLDGTYGWTASKYLVRSTPAITSLITIGTNLIAGTIDGGGVYRSTNNGTSWMPINVGMGISSDGGNPHVYALAVSGTSIFAGTDVYAYRSTNSGTSWTILTSSGMPSMAVPNLIASRTCLFAKIGNSDTYYRLTSNGTSWEPITCPGELALIDTNLFAFHRYGGYSNGEIDISTDNGTSWSEFWTLPWHPSSPPSYYRDFCASGKYLFWKFWVEDCCPPPFASIRRVSTIDTNTGGQMNFPPGFGPYVHYMSGDVSTCGTTVFLGTGEGGCLLSTNSGNDWSVLSLPPGVSSPVSPIPFITVGTDLFIGGTNVAGIWRNTISNALPIQLASFKVTGTTLTWTTVSETNNYGFYVKRDGADIAFVAGHGTTLQSHTYSYTDNPSPGQYQYQLKQVDLDGSATLSESVVVGVTAPTKFELKQNYPNPFNPSTRISFSLTKDGPVSLRVYDVLGREVTTLVNENRKAGQYTEQFIGNQVASGMYVYVLRSAEGQLVGRMMMLK